MIDRRGLFVPKSTLAAGSRTSTSQTARLAALTLFELPRSRLAEVIPSYTGGKLIVRNGEQLFTVDARGQEVQVATLDHVDRRLMQCFNESRPLREIAQTVAQEFPLPTDAVLDKACRLFLAMARHWLCIPANPL